MNLLDSIERARSTAEFMRLNKSVEERGVRTWSTSDERLLLFGVSAFCDSIRVVVEIGSYCGGSCAFLAGGLRHRGEGKIYCIDPFLGAPPWLGVPSIAWTLDEFTGNIQALGLDPFVELRVGVSTAVASVWPGVPIDLLFVDGDHSFPGTVADIESWVPKLRKGGRFLIDDIDNIPELKAVTRILREMRSLTFDGRVGGIDVYRVVLPGWNLLEEFTLLLEREGVSRAWNYRPLHATRVDESAGGFYRSASSISASEEGNYREVFTLASQAVAGGGDYAYTAAAHPSVRDMVYQVSLLRGDGKLFKIDAECAFQGRFRVVACGENEAQQMAPMLAPGGILIARGDDSKTPDELLALEQTFRAAGLVGTDFHRNEPHFFFGVSDPYSLSSEIIFSRRLARREKM